MGYTPPREPFRLNLDKYGAPKDYATYVWLLYRLRVDDRSPQRMAFLNGTTDRPLDFGQQLAMR